MDSPWAFNMKWMYTSFKAICNCNSIGGGEEGGGKPGFLLPVWASGWLPLHLSLFICLLLAQLSLKEGHFRWILFDLILFFGVISTDGEERPFK